MKRSPTIFSAALLLAASCGITRAASAEDLPTASSFAAVAFELLPVEPPYAYHETLRRGPVHRGCRDAEARPAASEMSLDAGGWSLAIRNDAGPLVRHAADDLREFLAVSMKTAVAIQSRPSLAGWKELRRSIVAGTAGQLPAVGDGLKGSKDYRIVVSPERIVVCGFDDLGVMHGLYDVEARMRLREGPFLPKTLDTVRRSLYRTRMALSWLGWMEWPDAYLAHLAHDGFDAIFASVMANPNGVEGPPPWGWIRKQDPARLRDLVRRASRQGIKVYAPILFSYTAEPDNEAALRKHVRDIVAGFPEIHGYILLTEGFAYQEFFGAGGQGRRGLEDWARHWTHAVAIVAEECHKIDPRKEIVPWDYNVDFRPNQVEIKRRVISLLPRETIPLVTWENGKGFQLDGLQGYITDQSINQVGPAEVAAAQIDEAKRRGMRVYASGHTFATEQFRTTPYLPCPAQWHRRYEAFARSGIDGTLETWTDGYTPSFVAELARWYSWSDAPPLEELLRRMAGRMFDAGSENRVLEAWSHFSRAIQLVPDTGPRMGTSNAVANPLFFQKPSPRMMTLAHSWWDQERIDAACIGSRLNPLWPYTAPYLVFLPDFSNRSNTAEQYARSASGIGRREDPKRLSGVLPVFLKHLLLAADEFESGLKPYRQAALRSAAAKRPGAFKEVLVAEQVARMLRSCHAVLEFEDLRFRLAKTADRTQQAAILGRLVEVARAERDRTRLSLQTARRDSRLGFECEVDYAYSPDVIQEKLWILDQVLNEQIPAFRRERGLP